MLGERVADQLADAQLALRGTGGSMVALMMSGHSQCLNFVVMRRAKAGRIQ